MLITLKSRKILLVVVPVILIILIAAIFLLRRPSLGGGPTINATNVSNLALGYGIPGSCQAFSPDSQLIAVSTGVYDTVTGQQRFPLYVKKSIAFSPDGRFLVVGSDGVYEVATGTRKFKIKGEYGSFTQDSELIIVPNDGVYEVLTGKKLRNMTENGIILLNSEEYLDSVGTRTDIVTGEERHKLPQQHKVADVSPDRKWIVSTAVNQGGHWMASDAGVYELSTGNQKFKFVNDGFVQNARFSSNGQYIVLQKTLSSKDVIEVYDIDTGQKQATIPGINFQLSGDGRYVASADSGVYELPTGKKLFELHGDSYLGGLSFSIENTLIAVGKDGVYDLPTGQKKIPFPQYRGSNPLFSKDGRLIAVTLDSRASACLLYGSNKNGWPYRVGIVAAKGRAYLKDQSGAFLSDSALVVAISKDSRWYKIATQNTGVVTIDGEAKSLSLVDYAWVEASQVEVLSMPDNLPRE